jgi:hypothetical protein
MICGWIYSIIMAMLPLFGMSNYSSTRWALCELLSALVRSSKLIYFQHLPPNGSEWLSRHDLHNYSI